MIRSMIHSQRRWRVWSVVFSLMIACSCLPTAQADETIEPGDSSSKTDEDLFKKLTGGEENADEGNPLERAIREMRAARKRIDEEDTGQATRKLQQDVVNSLELLIQQLKQQAQRRSSGNGSSKPQNGDSPADSDKPSEPNEPNPNDDGKTGDDKSTESTDNNRKPDDRRAAPVKSGRMVRDVWGHLPPKLREKLLNVYEDKYLPQYSDLVRRYFESLAEEGRPAPRTK